MNKHTANPLVERAASFLKQHEVTGRVTIALSGGIDSMVLLDVACKVQQQRALSAQNAPNTLSMLEIDALHIHHGLSPNADAWAAFCEEQCAVRGVPLRVVRVVVDRSDTGGLGVEGAAREARYAAFTAHGAPFILAAQHCDDQAETVLHQLLRGTGLNGLAGMGERRVLANGLNEQTLLRPLLGVARADIEAYAHEHRVAHIVDESNDDTTYTRNFLRHEVMPLLHARFPHADQSLARTARHAAESAALTEALAVLDLQWDGLTARAERLDAQDIVRQTNALYWWLKWQGVEGASHAELAEWARQLFRAPPLDKPHQAGGQRIIIRRKAGQLLLVRTKPA